jgi:hypothetical protein
MNARFLMMLSLTGALALPGWAGLVFDREVATESAAPSEETHESKFLFKNEGTAAVTIKEVQSSCGCLGASADKPVYQPGESGTISATIKLGSFEGEVIKSIYVLSDDPEAPKRMLQMKITIPRLMEVSPEVTTWSVGEEPKPKTLSIKVLRDQPIEVVAVSSTRDNFTVELKEIEKGRAYEVVMTPKSTSDPTLGAVKIETTCEISRYQNRLAFFNIVRPRRPAGTPAPAPGAATTPPVQAPPPAAATPAPK